MLNSVDVIDVLDPMPRLVPVGDAAGRFVQWRDGAVHLLDDRLSEIARRDLPLADDVCVLAASSLDRIVLDFAGGLAIAGDEVITVPGLRADAAAFLGHLLVVAVPDGQKHRLLALDPASGDLLHEQDVDAPDARAFLHPHPTGDTAVLELAMGQDGVLAYRVDVDGMRVHLAEILAGEDPVIAGFSPSGTGLLVTPYPSDPETVRILAWPSLKETAQLDASDVGAAYGFGLAGCWIDDELVAVYATEDSLIVTDSHFDSVERVAVPIDLREEGEIESLTRLTSGDIAVGAWTPAGRLTLIARIIDGKRTG